MRQTAVAYWLATDLLALFMTKSGQAYLTQHTGRMECQRLGFPNYFRVELGADQIWGVLALLGPRLKEWAYAGVVMLLVSAGIAHLAAGESLRACTGPVVLLGVLCWPRRTGSTIGGGRWLPGQWADVFCSYFRRFLRRYAVLAAYLICYQCRPVGTLCHPLYPAGGAGPPPAAAGKRGR